MIHKKQGLIGIFLPTPFGWIVVGALFTFFLVSPPRFFDRIFDFMDKGAEYPAVTSIIALLICTPYYLKLKKKLRKYEEEDKWDDK